MKKTKRFTTLLLALATVLIMAQAAFAEDLPAVKAGTFTYSGGSSIKVTDTEEVNDAITGMQPGDSITFTQTYVNDTDHGTDWYLKNDVIQTLEDQAENAENGGYTYVLKAGGETLFDSSQVGGTDSASSSKGLEQADDVTENQWIHIDKLAAKGTGTTTLKIALDGESQGNPYEAQTAIVALQYAVEDEAVGEDIINHVKGKGVNTGDQTNILLPIAAFVGALLLLVLAFISYRKDRKDGDEA